MRIALHDRSDPEASCVFIPSCPCLERQKTYQYRITRAASATTSNGTAYLNLGKRENTASQLFEAGCSMFPTIFISAISIAIISAMSGFHARNSTFLQRLATMTWVSAGIYFGSSIRSCLILCLSFPKCMLCPYGSYVSPNSTYDVF
jgi:hypothetical protein